MNRDRPEEIEHEIELTRSEMSQTLQAIERKLSPRQLMEDAMESVRDAAIGKSQFGRVVRENPVPLALLGLGIGWLMVSSMRSPREQFPEDAYGAEEIGGEGVGESGYEASGYGTGYSGGVAYGSDLASEYETDFGAELGGDGGASAAEKAKHRLKNAGARAGQMATQAQHQAEMMAYSVRRQANEVAWRSRRMFEEHPLTMGLMAVMVGAAVEASLPRTRREQELVGDASRDVLRSAQEAGGEMMRKAERVMGRAAEAARAEGMEELRRETGGGGDEITGSEPATRVTH